MRLVDEHVLYVMHDAGLPCNKLGTADKPRQAAPGCMQLNPTSQSMLSPIQQFEQQQARGALLSAKAAWGPTGEQVLGYWGAFGMPWPCASPSWPYVVCSQGVVTGLELGNQGLQGPLPAQVLQLPGIQYVNLTANALNGPLPSAISPSLVVVDVSDNQLQQPYTWQGWAPAEQLQHLNLSGNPLGVSYTGGTCSCCEHRRLPLT
jgi:hypothetical protein